MLHYKTYFAIFITFFSLSLNINLYSQYSISGHVSFSDNGAPVTNGYVYILEFINSTPTFLDSTYLNSDGSYNLNTYHSDSVLACTGWVKHNDPGDHVTTYYPSTIDWQQARKIYPPADPSDINILVNRIVVTPGNSVISGTILTLNSNGLEVPVKGAIVVAKQDTLYRNFAVTDSLGNYCIDSASSGTFMVVATKAGYTMDSTVVNTSGNIAASNRIRLKKVCYKNILAYKKPQKFQLLQNYPNPFNPKTVIKYSLLCREMVVIKIYDMVGKELVVLINKEEGPGSYELMWDGSNYSSGVYFYKLETKNFVETKKMIMIK